MAPMPVKDRLLIKQIIGFSRVMFSKVFIVNVIGFAVFFPKVNVRQCFEMGGVTLNEENGIDYSKQNC